MSRPDLNELLPVLFDFARLMLGKAGEFPPFAAAPFQRDVDAGELRAAGVCIDVRTIPPGKAIIFSQPSVS